MQIDVLRPQDLTAAQVARWSELQLADPAFDSPFLSPYWARAVERAQGLDRSGLRAVALSEDRGAVGFTAAHPGAFTAMPPGAPMCDYQAVVCAAGCEFDPRDIVEALGVHRYDFAAMLESQSAFAPFARGRAVSRVVDVSQGWDAYEADRKAAGFGFIKDVEKKRRKAARDLGEPRFTAFSRATSDFENMLAWKRTQLRVTGQRDIFETRWTERLLRDLFESRDPEFGGVLFTLHFGDRLAAAQFDVHGRETVHAWIISHDTEFDRYSPGMMLFVDLLRWMGTTPYRRLDLGVGEQRFKRELSNAGRPVTQGCVGVPSAALLVRDAAYRVMRAAEALPLGAASELPAKAMRRVDQWRGLRLAR